MQEISRVKDHPRCYGILEMLEVKLGGKSTFGGVRETSIFANRGVYFTFESCDAQTADFSRLSGPETSDGCTFRGNVKGSVRISENQGVK